MIDENKSPDFDLHKNEDENKIKSEEDNSEPDFESPKKRITRRKISSPSIHSSLPPKEKKTEQKKDEAQINQVLENLYGDKKNRVEVSEITMEKPNLFLRLSSALSIIFLFSAAIWGGFFLIPNKNDNSQVGLTINGPKDLVLGATSTYHITYENKSNTTLHNVVLNAYFPEGFTYLSSSQKPSNNGHNEWNIDSLSPYQKGTISITGLTYGSLNDQKSWRVFLNYLPANFNSELQKAATLSTNISTSPVKLVISGPDQTAVGNDVTYTFSLQRGNTWKDPVTIVPQLPANFSISSSSPAFDKKNNQWTLPASTSATSSLKTFSLAGKFTSAPDEPTPIKGFVTTPALNGQNYQIALAEISTALLKNDVSVSLAINGAISDFDSKPGELLNITLRIKNQSANDVNTVVPKIIFTAPAEKKISLLKWSELVDKNENTLLGEQVDDYTRRGIISWNKDQLSSLAKIKSGEEISIDLQLPIKKAGEFNLDSITSPLISVLAEAKFKDVTKTTQTVGIKPINITLNSDLTFSAENNLSGGGTENEKYTINWVLNNSFHPLKNVKIVATTFGDVNFTLLDKSAGDLVYNPEENKIIWNIDEVPKESDIANCSFTLNLNRKNPSQTLLLSKAHLTATDAITGKSIDLAGEEISLTQN